MTQKSIFGQKYKRSNNGRDSELLWISKMFEVKQSIGMQTMLKNTDIFKNTIAYEMKSSEKEFRAVQTEYAKQLNFLYERKDMERRKAEKSIKDFVITF